MSLFLFDLSSASGQSQTVVSFLVILQRMNDVEKDIIFVRRFLLEKLLRLDRGVAGGFYGDRERLDVVVLTISRAGAA